ncbi:MAG: hypothetical protein A2Z81_03180 [Omnitrophica WOR_2 bacterium GWA2_45_18]|nr:MAG: hypothetical protein A2Z81_03180 [Omnitrophica WOR_2 bacterium GWA2_45_18]
MFKLGFPELVVIFLAVVLLFGPRALPGIARGLAEAIRNFKKTMSGCDDGDDQTKEKKENNDSPKAPE